VVAEAGIVSQANRNAIEDATLSHLIGERIPEIPYQVKKWRTDHAGEQIADGPVCGQPWPATEKQRAQGRGDKVVYYRYKADRARRTLPGIDEQVARAEKAVAGKVPVKRNRFIKLAGAEKSVNRELEAGQGPRTGRVQGPHHQHREPDTAVRDRRLPPAVAHRAVVPGVPGTT